MTDDFSYNPKDVDWSQLEALANGEEPKEGTNRDQITLLTPEMLSRRFVWDTSPCDLAEMAAEILALPPTSSEVDETEHARSHERLEPLIPLASLIFLLTRHATQGVLASLVAQQIEADPNDRDEAMAALPSTVAKLTPLMVSTTFAVLANMVDMGTLTLTKTDIKDWSALDEDEEP